MAGEFVAIAKDDQTSAARAFNRPPGAQGAPVTKIDSSRSPTQQRASEGGPAVRDFQKRLALAVWHGGGWDAETIEMLNGFFQFDGQQDRSCYLLQSPVRPISKAVIDAAKEAFTDVRIVETNFANPEDGIITPHALYDFAGAIPQRLGHKSRVFYTMPLKVVGPNSLARLEQDSVRACPGRGRDNKLQGKPILGAVRTSAKGDKYPFSSFVAVPTWVGEPEFPLFKGLSKFPAKDATQIPMNFLRYELLRNMMVTDLINAEPDKMPSDPRFVVLEARKFNPERWPAQEIAPRPQLPAVPQVAVHNDDEFNPPKLSDIIARNLEGDETGPQPIATVSEVPYMKEFPPLEEAVARVEKEGLGWLVDYNWSTDLASIKALHNAEVIRRARITAENQPLADEPAPPAKVAAKKPAKKAPKAALPVSAA